MSYSLSVLSHSHHAVWLSLPVLHITNFNVLSPLSPEPVGHAFLLLLTLCSSTRCIPDCLHMVIYLLHHWVEYAWVSGCPRMVYDLYVNEQGDPSRTCMFFVLR